MATINYTFADGRTQEIEVSEELKAEYEKILKNEENNERRETRRHVSLDELKEDELSERSLEKESSKYQHGRYSLISKESDPLKIILINETREEEESIFDLLDLTDYQRKVAIKHYIEHKEQVVIAKEKGVNQSSVSRILKKINLKMDKFFINC